MGYQSENGRHTRGDGLFDATQWSLVLRAKDKCAVALNELCAKYRSPMIIWLRSKGCSEHDAEDLVQSLFEKFLSIDFLSNVTREKGHFRTFIRTCLKHHLLDEQDRRKGQRRGGGQIHHSLEETYEDGERVYNPADEAATPDEAFDRAWVTSLLHNVMNRLQSECAQQGHAVLFAALEKTLHRDDDAQAYRDIGAQLEMSEAAVKMAARRIRVRLRGIIGEEVRQTVSNQEEFVSEVDYLMQLFK